METKVEMAQRHVHQGEAHVARQLDLIDEMRRDGHDIRDAEALLETMEETLRSYREHLAIELDMAREQKT